MTQPLVISVTNYEASFLAGFLQKRFHGAATETHHTVYDAVASLEEKSPDDLARVRAVIIQDRLPLYYPHPPAEETPLHRLIRDTFSSAELSDRGSAVVEFLRHEFNLTRKAEYYLYTTTPEYKRELPKKLTGVISHDFDADFTVTSPSQILAHTI